MLWPDMIWVYVLAYDIWNFQYTYLNLPTHSWYCGLALLLAPTFAAALWNKGGWIQNRANTLALWCMFAQVFPLFQDASRFTTVTSVYGQGGIAAAMGSSMPTIAEPTAQGIISVLSFAVNVFVFAYILKRAKVQKRIRGRTRSSQIQKITKKQWKEHKDEKGTDGGRCLFLTI